MNNQSDTPKRRLTLISKNGSIHLGLVEDKTASPHGTDDIQLEVDFNQAATKYQ